MDNKAKELNSILLNRRQSVSIGKSAAEADKGTNLILAATISKNLEAYGYRLSGELMEEMTGADAGDIIQTGSMLMDFAKERAGDTGSHAPFYPGFPEQVMEKSEAELYFNAAIYYMTGIMPADCVLDEEKSRHIVSASKKFDGKIKEIGSAGEEELKEIYRNLCSSQAAFSPQDREDAGTLLKWVPGMAGETPETIPNKENLVSLTMEAVNAAPKETGVFMQKYKTATDVLRFINALNGGDAALTTKVKFAPASHGMNKMIAKMFDRASDPEGDMAMRPEMFKRAAHQYHSARYCKAQKMKSALTKLYKGELKSYEAKIDQALAGMGVKKQPGAKEDPEAEKGLMTLLAKKPGYMATHAVDLWKRLGEYDERRKKGGNESHAREDLLKTFSENAGKIETLTLIRMAGAVQGEIDASEKDADDGSGHGEAMYKAYSSNKGLSQPWMGTVERPSYSGEEKESLLKFKEAAYQSLKERYKEKRPLGKTYIDPALGKVKLPKERRNASKGAQQLPYASRLPVKNGCDHLRAFLWWTNDKNGDRTDIDLSATFFKEGFEKEGREIAYYNLRNEYAVHSGDFTDGGTYMGDGVSEYIDIDLGKAKEAGVRYITFDVNSFTDTPFKDLPCRFGWMEYEKEMDAAYDPGKVRNAVRLGSDGTMSTPAAYDMEAGEFVWMDANRRNGRYFECAPANAICFHGSAITCETFKAMNDTGMSLGDIVSLHAAGRSEELVDDPKLADTAFTLQRLNRDEMDENTVNISAYDTDYILAELVSDRKTQADLDYETEQAREAGLEEEAPEK